MHANVNSETREPLQAKREHACNQRPPRAQAAAHTQACPHDQSPLAGMGTTELEGISEAPGHTQKRPACNQRILWGQRWGRWRWRPCSGVPRNQRPLGGHGRRRGRRRSCALHRRRPGGAAGRLLRRGEHACERSPMQGELRGIDISLTQRQALCCGVLVDLHCSNSREHSCSLCVTANMLFSDTGLLKCQACDHCPQVSH